jgi:hypothetical protein
MVSKLTRTINGIPPPQRARYGRLVETFRRAIEDRRELPDGYAFQMDTRQIGTGQLVEWVEFEQQCCPFFRFELRWDRENGSVWLHLTEPEGVKEFILDEFGLRQNVRRSLTQDTGQAKQSAIHVFCGGEMIIDTAAFPGVYRQCRRRKLSQFRRAPGEKQQKPLLHFQWLWLDRQSPSGTVSPSPEISDTLGRRIRRP